MSEWNWYFLIAALAVAWTSKDVPRAWLWIALGAASYTISVIYWRHVPPLGYAEGVAGACDAVVCLSIYFMAKERWEKFLYVLFATSVAVNFLYLGGNIYVGTWAFGFPMYIPHVDHEVYSSLLEVLNALVLLLIGGMGLGRRIGATDARSHRPWSYVHRAMQALHAPRKSPHFLAVR